MQTSFNKRQPSVNVHQFAMVPRAEIPRSQFRMQTIHKTTFSGARLIPIYLQEVLPGDSFNVSMTAFTRTSTPIVPIMDNLTLETWFFFIPNRLIWAHWVNFMGEQANPADSISFTIPTVTSPAGGFTRLTLADYFGLPCAGQTLGGNTITVSALPYRAYALTYNTWFRDENLVNSATFDTGDGPVTAANSYNQQPFYRLKRHDYFTGCLPWTQKGGVAVTLPLTGNATVRTQATNLVTGTAAAIQWLQSNAGGAPPASQVFASSGAAGQFTTWATPAPATPSATLYPANLYADLSTVTATTINALRLAFQTQKLLERDARGGTRYTEIVRSHFGVVSPDARQQRPELCGMGSSAVTITPVAQTAQTGLTGGSTPLGTLAAIGTNVHHGHGFKYSSTEHGYIIGLCNVRADLSYQQGIRRLWTRSTRYDFYFPVFAMLGEQAVLNSEIYSDGSANDALTFGYQERWAEYRYHPSMITGYFNSTNPTPLDFWHLSQKFTALPTLNTSFIASAEDVILERVMAGGVNTLNQQFLSDFFFDMKVARPMPMYSVPGLIDHF